MNHTVNIDGLINQSHVRVISSAITFLDNDPLLHLEIQIDSAGGNPDPAKEIFDLLKDYRGRTTCSTTGKCMSSAVLIYLAADIRLASKDAEFMIHPTSWTLWGTFDFLKMYKGLDTGDLILSLAEVYTLQALLNTAATRLNEIEDYTDKIYKERAKLTKKQFHDRRSVKTDHIFTAQESLQMGIVTKII
jgi:ATP-dependent protease ClpP protease subunit